MTKANIEKKEKEFLDHWPVWLRWLLKRVLGIHWMIGIVAKARVQSDKPNQFVSNFFKRNDFDVQIKGLEHLDNIDNGFIIAGNHPHGLYDGVALGLLAEKKDRHFKMMARSYLTIFTSLMPNLLPLEVDKNRRSKNGGLQLTNAINWLKQGECIVITPAGHLSLPKKGFKFAQDKPWRSGFARMSVESGCPILPVSVDMTLPNWIIKAHQISPMLRAMLQVWGFLFGKSEVIKLTVHAPIFLNQSSDIKAETQRIQQLVCDPFKE